MGRLSNVEKKLRLKDFLFHLLSFLARLSSYEVPYHPHPCIFIGLKVEIHALCHPYLALIVIQGLLGKADLFGCLLKGIRNSTLLESIVNLFPTRNIMMNLSNGPLLRFAS